MVNKKEKNFFILALVLVGLFIFFNQGTEGSGDVELFGDSQLESVAVHRNTEASCLSSRQDDINDGDECVTQCVPITQGIIDCFEDENDNSIEQDNLGDWGYFKDSDQSCSEFEVGGVDEDPDYFCMFEGSGGENLLSVDSNPEEAQIIVDGVVKGFTPMLVPLSTGNHNLLLLLNGFIDFEQTVNIQSGQTTYVDANLIPVGSPEITHESPIVFEKTKYAQDEEIVLKASFEALQAGWYIFEGQISTTNNNNRFQFGQAVLNVDIDECAILSGAQQHPNYRNKLEFLDIGQRVDVRFQFPPRGNGVNYFGNDDRLRYFGYVDVKKAVSAASCSSSTFIIGSEDGSENPQSSNDADVVCDYTDLYQCAGSLRQRKDVCGQWINWADCADEGLTCSNGVCGGGNGEGENGDLVCVIVQNTAGKLKIPLPFVLDDTITNFDFSLNKDKKNVLEQGDDIICDGLACSFKVRYCVDGVCESPEGKYLLDNGRFTCDDSSTGGVNKDTLIIIGAVIGGLFILSFLKK